MKAETGFSLIELLAVIVILAVIALITTPLIMGTITKSKRKAFQNTAFGILKAGEQYATEKLLESENDYYGERIVLPDSNRLKYKGGSNLEGELLISSSGNLAISIFNNQFCAVKEFNDKLIIKNYEENNCYLENKELTKLQGAAKKIFNKNVDNNSEGLFTDDYGNIRYRGSNNNVKNYVFFHQQLWRIVGIFEGKIKLVSEQSIGQMAWNEGANFNQWDTSSLKKYLNENYYNQFTNEEQKQISNTKVYLGSNLTADVTKDTMYEIERNNKSSSCNNSVSIQNVGLLYPSDYGYAADEKCVEKLNNYSSNVNCYKNGNWLYHTNHYWLQMPYLGSTTTAFFVSVNGNIINSRYTTVTSDIYPTIMLNENVDILSGNGTKEDPYII